MTGEWYDAKRNLTLTNDVLGCWDGKSFKMVSVYSIITSYKIYIIQIASLPKTSILETARLFFPPTMTTANQNA